MILVLLAALAQEPRPLDPTPLAITHVNLIPLDRDTVIADQTVVIANGVITAVSSAKQAHVPRNARVLDGRDRYLIPGLIDSHVHLKYLADSTANPGILKQFLDNGVTTTVNLLGLPEHLQLRQRISDGQLSGPQLFTSGFFVNAPYVKSASEAAQSVRNTGREGYDFVKIHADMPLEWYDSIYTAAKQANIRVVGHAPRALGMQVAYDHGISAVAHLEEYVYAYFTNEHSPLIEKLGVPSYLAQIADSARASGVAVMTTLIAFAAVPQEKRPPTFDNQYRLQGLLAKTLLDKGVPVLAGTDVDVNGNIPGVALHDELRRLVAAGFTPYEALRSATAVPAAFLRVNSGTIAVGRRADLLLLDANPLASIENSRAIRVVIVRGEIQRER
jgi:imidazolonepropionase-like amidohydrolase